MNIINYFKKDSIQRRTYIVMLICWIFIFTNESLRMRLTSATDHLPLIFIIPVALCVLQALFNNRVLWYVILTALVSYTLWSFLSFFMFVALDTQQAYVNTTWLGAGFVEIGLTLFGFLLINGLVFLIKSSKNHK